MNYGDLKTHIRDEAETQFSDDLFERWQEIVRAQLRRDQVLNDLIVSGSVTPTTNPFSLGSEDYEDIRSLWWSDGSYSYPLVAMGAERARDWEGVTGVDPAFYIRVGNKVEVFPGISDKTFYFIATQRDSAMTADSDQSTSLEVAPGLVVAAFLKLAYRRQQDFERAQYADNDYQTELDKYRESETYKTAASAAQASGAWTWV